MDTTIYTLTDIFPYIQILGNIISFGVGTILGGLLFGGFVYGFNSND